MRVELSRKQTITVLPGHAVLQVYGSYYRKLSKKAQAALAEANAVAEEVLSAQSTVRCIS
jgi:ABC-type multidrug transport system fused ATPase/permease subunit